MTIKTPGNELPPTQMPYKSMHMKYTLPDGDDQWNLVAIEPFFQRSKEGIEEMMIHLCQSTINTYKENAIWYDDATYCNGARSMLIYKWISYAPISSFQIADDLGFRLDKSISIVLTITYSKQRQSHIQQAGVILHISTVIPRFYVGTILVGNDRKGLRQYKAKDFLSRILSHISKGFSCRSANYPRLLYAFKPLFPKANLKLWRIYVIRSRHFGRKLVQSVGDSAMYLRENNTDLEMISSDVFLISGDYILVECIQVSDSNCKFLIYYTYKNVPYKNFHDNDDICKNNDYPNLFKLIPSNLLTNTIPPQVSSTDSTTVFLLVCLFLLIIWISIIIGCVIMRHIRGLVNFRAEPLTPSSGGAHCTKGFFAHKHAHDHHQQKLAAEGDHTAQLDVEHMGLMH